MRQALIARIKDLLKKHNAKVVAFQQKNGYSDEVGCMTREACELARLQPVMHKLGVTLDDCK